MVIRPIDIKITGLTVFGEARGEPREGQYAVAQVVRNRALANNTYPAVECLRPFQFSCWNKNDPNYSLLQPVLKGIRDIPSIYYKIADDVLNGRVLLDNIDGARYYMTRRLYYSDRCPSWANKMRVVAEIGNHVFLTEEE
jgi:hypothetical protein